MSFQVKKHTKASKGKRCFPSIFSVLLTCYMPFYFVTLIWKGILIVKHKNTLKRPVMLLYVVFCVLLSIVIRFYFVEILQSIYNYGIRGKVFHKMSKVVRKNRF